MREIRFRGKSITADWIAGYGVIVYPDNSRAFIVDQSPDRKSKNELYEVDPTTIGQFTGLQDKNGMDVWEGDIMDYGNNRHKEVIFYNGSFCLKGLESMTFLIETCIIIGDIHTK